MWAARWVGAPGEVGIDEGVAVLQAQALADDGAWTLDHPLEAVDPAGSAFPLRSTSRTEDGYVPFAKHPLYPRLLAWTDDVGGVAAMVGLSIAGAVVAAMAAGWLAGRLDRRLAAPSLWVTGVASPLLFDSGIVLAHTLGAAAAGLGAVAVVRHLDEGRAVSRWLAVVAPCVAAVVLLRGEGILLAGAVAAVTGGVAVARRHAAWGSAALSVAVLGGVSLLADRRWSSSILGASIGLPGGTAADDSLLEGRIAGLVTTTVRPSYAADDRHLLLIGGVALLAIVVLALRRGGSDERMAGGAAAVSAALVVLWAVSGRPGPVPGLLLAFPVLWVGLALGRWGREPAARALVAVGAVFAGAVAATQYRQGGGFEWGARYVALALPLVVPVAVLGLARAWDAIDDRRVGRAVAVGLAVTTLALGGVAIASQQRLGGFNRSFGSELIAVAPDSRLGGGDRDGRPIIVGADFLIPQLVWPQYDRARWLRIRGDGPIVVDGPDPRVEALFDAGVDRFTFVTRDLDRDRPLLGEARLVSRREQRGWEVAVVEPPS